MESSIHTMNNLFQQLGLPSDTASIDDFVAGHGPLAPEVELSQASFWTPAQATFLKEQIVGDADWAEVVDQLNNLLRG